MPDPAGTASALHEAAGCNASICKPSGLCLGIFAAEGQQESGISLIEIWLTEEERLL